MWLFHADVKIVETTFHIKVWPMVLIFQSVSHPLVRSDMYDEHSNTVRHSETHLHDCTRDIALIFFGLWWIDSKNFSSIVFYSQISTTLYAWLMMKKIMHQLYVFPHSCLQKIFQITCRRQISKFDWGLNSWGRNWRKMWREKSGGHHRWEDDQSRR